ncbi:MAG: hypothetical protein ABEJ60_00955 [Halodesulfurarchaeum sp.]
MSTNHETETVEPMPGVFALLLFGFALAALGAEHLISSAAHGAVVFGILIAAIGEVVGGLWEIKLGENYTGNLVTVFGTWLIGLFMLEFVGPSMGLITPMTIAVYFMALVPPIVMFWIPVFPDAPWNIHGAFATLMGLVLVSSIAQFVSMPSLGYLTGILAWGAAFCIWSMAWEDLQDLQ